VRPAFSRAGVPSKPRPLYLVCARRIGQEDATDRPRPWSIKTTKKFGPSPITARVKSIDPGEITDLGASDLFYSMSHNAASVG
jgi:hypothetical protein